MKKRIFLIVSACLFASIGFVAYKFFGPAVHTRNDGAEYLFIKTGADIEDVKKELIEKKHLPTSAWFNAVANLLKYKIPKPGRYKLSKGLSIYHLVRMLRNGSQTPVNLVITKQRTREDLSKRVGALFEIDSTRFMHFISNNDSIRIFEVDTNTVTALALPLTYSMNWNTTPQKLLQQFHKSWTSFWTSERRQQATALGLTPIQVSTLASIIDEETNKPTDRPNIASVYLNRIKLKMPLQADPTIKFALKDFSLKRILNGHLQIQSPYNTYLNAGLPPGPICTPQTETIEAVLNAPDTDYLYFVANSNFDGTHIFTSNYTDHMKYARQYQEALTKLLESQKNK